MAAARQRLAAGQGELDLGLDTAAPGGPLPITSSRMGHLWDALAYAYRVLGFEDATRDDEVFRQLVLARIIEPASKLDSGRVLEEAGVRAPSYRTLLQRLPAYAKQAWRQRLSAACAAHAGLGPASLVLYDVSTLYFETDAGDGFREPGFSKERRLDPQITIGLLTGASGFPLMVSAFEGNKAETKTMLPVIQAFMAAHQLPDVTVVADAGMVSEANQKQIEAAGLSFILGMRIPEVPYVVTEWHREHPSEPVPDGHIFTQRWPAGPSCRHYSTQAPFPHGPLSWPVVVRGSHVECSSRHQYDWRHTLMATIAELILAQENRRRDAERRQADANKMAESYLAALESAGLEKLTAEQEQRSEALLAKVRAAKDEIRQADGAIKALREAQAEDEELDRRSREVRSTGVQLPGGDTTVRIGHVRDSAVPAAAGEHVWRYADTGREAAVSRGQSIRDHELVREQIARASGRDNAIIGQHGDIGQQMRALTTSTGSAIVPTVWAANIIDRARNYAAVIRAGAQTVPMNAKIVQIGRLTADPAAAFRTEGSTITASDPTFDNVTLTAKTLNALVVGSTEFWQDASNAGELVTEAMAKALAVQIDLVALLGGVTTGAEQTGTGNNMLASGGLPNPPNPSGILATLLANASSSVLGGQTNGTVQTATSFYGEVLDTLYTPRDFNEAPNALLWPSHLARIYAKAADTTNQPMRMPPDVEAVQRFVTNQIPSGFTQGTGTLMSDLFVGDFTQLLVGQRLDVTVKVLDQRYAELGQTAVLCSWRGDIAVARPRAFAVFRYLKGV